MTNTGQQTARALVTNTLVTVIRGCRSTLIAKTKGLGYKSEERMQEKFFLINKQICCILI